MEKINIQMYSFEDGSMSDYRENLKMASQMGYTGVELFGPCLEIPVEEMKILLKELNLEPISIHESSAKIEERIPYAKELGVEFITIGMEGLNNEDEVHKFAEKLNSLGKICTENGILLTYHNHTQEFASFNNQMIFDTLMKETEPEFVGFELDAGWCAAAGIDPLEILEKYSGRIKLIHIKESSEVIGALPPFDFSKISFDENGNPIFPEEVLKMFAKSKAINCAPGQGLVDWKQLKTIADRQGCKAYIVERENTYQGTRLDCLKADLEYYKKILY